MHESPLKRRGRGALSNATGRHELVSRHDIDDGWNHDGPENDEPCGASAVRTQWRVDSARTIITRNRSPDVHFDRSINPYRGCEHGCIYCFARPSHTWLGHSAGLDFERLLYAKTHAASLLRRELASAGYRCEPVAVGVNTDAWQPLEKKLGLTRELLEVLDGYNHPAYLITKSSLIERDIDILPRMAKRNLVTVSITLTTLDNELASRLEPRATAPHRRLRTMRLLTDAGIPVRASISPVIPALNEMELDDLLAAAAEVGAVAATAILLRLPHELATLFPEWLEAHYPLRAARVLKAIRSMRDEHLNDSAFTTRFVGKGPRAALIQRRFELACKRLGMCAQRNPIRLDTSAFRSPRANGQLSLFDD